MKDKGGPPDTIDKLYNNTFGGKVDTKDDDANVAVLPGTYGPYACARDILEFVKNGDGMHIRGLVSFIIIETRNGRGIVPFNSGVGLNDMALVAMACNSLSVQYMISAQQPVDAPDPNKGDTA